MMKAVTAAREWTTETGMRVKASVDLCLTKTINADGDLVEVDCCEMGEVEAQPAGHPEQSGYQPFSRPRTQGGMVYVASIGNLGLTAASNAIVKDMIAEIKSHPAMVAKRATADRSQREIAEMESRRARSGMCPKCGSHCYGDCEA